MTRGIQPIDWASLGANLGSTLLFTLLLLSPFLWGAAVWHWLLAVASVSFSGATSTSAGSATRNPGRTPTRPDFRTDHRLAGPPITSSRAAFSSLPSKLVFP
jgi:hypothetical protein